MKMYIVIIKVINTFFDFYRYDFTGTLIVVPDVGSLSVSNSKTEVGPKNRNNEQREGVSGLKTLGVRELTYKTAFLACSITATSSRVSRINKYAKNILLLLLKRQIFI